MQWGWILGLLEDYLSEVRDIRLSGEALPERSYYPALAGLLEEVGGGLKPKVRCFMELKEHGAGLPDGGLFTADQVRKGGSAGRSRPAGPSRSNRPLPMPPPSPRRPRCSATWRAIGRCW